MNTLTIQKHFLPLADQKYFFSDPIGKKLQSTLKKAQSEPLSAIYSPLLNHYMKSQDYKTPDLWHHYLLSQFVSVNYPEHQAFYSGFSLPVSLQNNYLQNVLIPFQQLFNACSIPVAPIEQHEIPYLEQRKKLYQAFLQGTPQAVFQEAQAYFYKAGFGFFSKYYYYEWDKKLSGIPSYQAKFLDDLSGYEDQKKAVLENTLYFLNHQPANHVFLYGSRGTGKTSLIKAQLEAFKLKGLRLIKVFRENIEILPQLCHQLSCRKEKFIINLDDISYDEGEYIYKKHKVALDSFFDRKPSNVLLYATSNSQEIVKYFRQETTDNFILDNRSIEERKLELPHRQVYDERRAFTERFGLSIYFGRTDEKAAEEILALYQKKYQSPFTLGQLKQLYQQWVIYHGSVNGRTIESFFKSLQIQPK